MNAIRGMEAKVKSLPYSGRVSGQPFSISIGM